MGDLYDDGIFGVILNDRRKQVIPVINEIFREEYTGEKDKKENKKIEVFLNEYLIGRQDDAEHEAEEIKGRIPGHPGKAGRRGDRRVRRVEDHRAGQGHNQGNHKE